MDPHDVVAAEQEILSVTKLEDNPYITLLFSLWNRMLSVEISSHTGCKKCIAIDMLNNNIFRQINQLYFKILYLCKNTTTHIISKLMNITIRKIEFFQNNQHI